MFELLNRTNSKETMPACFASKTNKLTIPRLEAAIPLLPVTFDLSRDPDICAEPDSVVGYYQLNFNDISLQPKQNFADDLIYYLVLVHETTHWTGGHGQLDRVTKLFRLCHCDAIKYRAAEELVAELVSCTFLTELGYKLPAWALDRMLFFKKQLPEKLLAPVLVEAERAYHFIRQLF